MTDTKTGSAQERDLLCAMVWTAPLYKCDAIVVLCGEDAAPRLATAVGLMQSGAASRIVLSGGRHERPRWVGAESLAKELLGLGVAPDAIIIEHGSQNTKEQAVNVLDLAAANQWRSLMIVASAYHLPRAFLTFVARNNGTSSDFRMLPVSCGDVSWFGTPAGMNETRATLLESELRKIHEHQLTGDVASYRAGVAFLRAQEGR